MPDKKTVVVGSPKHPGNKPFTLMWVDEVGKDALKKSNAVFSEAVNGMTGEKVSEFEDAETTGGGGNNPEGADTTFSVA